jgi:DNA-binding transcriptional ArsR family regulator
MSRPATRNETEDDLDTLFKALGDRTRRHMLSRLSGGPMFVTELAEPFSMSLAAASKHIDVLERAGLVRREREGRFLRCHLTPAPLADAGEFIERYRSFWETTLDQLAAFVEEPAPRKGPVGAGKDESRAR